MSEVMKHDVDALETQEWLQALESVVREEGVERAQFLLEQVMEKARLDGVDMPTGGYKLRQHHSCEKVASGDVI